MNDLLRAILDNPEDDTLRLVYADYLEEQDGQAERDRGELIRRSFTDEGPCVFDPPLSMSLSANTATHMGPTGIIRERSLVGTDHQLKYLLRADDAVRFEDRLYRITYLNPSEGKFSAKEGALSPPAKTFDEVRRFRELKLKHRYRKADKLMDEGWKWAKGFYYHVNLSMKNFFRQAPTLFRAHPITSASLSDKRPFNHSWRKPNSTPISCSLSGALWDLLEQAMGGIPKHSHYLYPWDKNYESDQEANKDLSQALVKWGRKFIDR